MANTQINIVENGTTTLATAGKYCDRNVDVVVNVEGGGGDLPPEALVITGDCSYMFAGNKWNWFIEQYGNQITTENIKKTYMMFANTTLEDIPFDINQIGTSNNSCDYMFQNARNLKSIGSIHLENVHSIPSLFEGCINLRNIPITHFSCNPNGSYRGSMFRSCYSLRSLPSLVLENMLFTTSTYSGFYYYTFYYCFTLDEVTNMPVSPVTYTSNAFSDTFYYCSRLKKIVFHTNNGAPETANWKNQTITFGTAGYMANLSASYIINHNSGITADKQVTDAASYEALKNDADWFTTDINYSRYNHDSAVETINSLPDTSAYLATAGGTNTIKFKGASGALTDGGAINTLTAEEIAVATAKGWTVTLV